MTTPKLAGNRHRPPARQVHLVVDVDLVVDGDGDELKPPTQGFLEYVAVAVAVNDQVNVNVAGGRYVDAGVSVYAQASQTPRSWTSKAPLRTVAGAARGAFTLMDVPERHATVPHWLQTKCG